MIMTVYDVEYYVNVAKAIFDKQTGDELAEIKKHFGGAYNEAKIVAMVAVKLLARIAGLKEESQTRTITPMDRLVNQAMKSL